jgi:tetratricopeptide (TPR) repeat protein
VHITSKREVIAAALAVDTVHTQQQINVTLDAQKSEPNKMRRTMDNIAERALQALRLDDPNKTRKIIEELIEQAPDRIDLRHSLAVTLLRMGESGAARLVIQSALDLIQSTPEKTAKALIGQLYLAEAEACCDLYLPREAEKAYQFILQNEENNPYALQNYAYLLFRWGQTTKGMETIKLYIDTGTDEPDAIKGNQAYHDAVAEFLSNDIHPKEFLTAHCGSYIEFFDHHSEQMSIQGWLAEQPYVKSVSEGGKIEYYVKEGERSYSTTRIDLIDPKTQQGGRVGDRPMLAALADYQPLAHAPILFKWPGYPFTVYVSSNCSWNNLSIHIRCLDGTWEDVDAYIGDWYQSGYHGAFGQGKHGFFHEIGQPQIIDEKSVNYYMDCGRAGVECIEDLLQRLEIAHNQFGVECVIFGEGFLP